MDLEGEDAPSSRERPVLERAVETGYIEQADYKDAVQDWITCLNDGGYTLEVTQHISGVTEVQPAPSDTPLIESVRGQQVWNECGKDTTHLVALYNLQQGNPKLYTNPHQAMVECLEDSGLLQTGDYTAEELADKLKTRNGFRDLPFNVNEPGPQNCFYSAGLAIKVDY